MKDTMVSIDNLCRGFSNYFARPQYQASSVSAYFAQHDPAYNSYTIDNELSPDEQVAGIGANGGIYNKAGR